MSHNGGYDKGGCHPEIRPLGHFRRSSRSNDFFHHCSCLIDLRFPANLTLKVRCISSFTIYNKNILSQF